MEFLGVITLKFEHYVRRHNKGIWKRSLQLYYKKMKIKRDPYLFIYLFFNQCRHCNVNDVITYFTRLFTQEVFPQNPFEPP